MPSTIRKIRLLNFKRFRDYTIEPKPRINVLVGDNEVGKSSVLEAIDLVAKGNIRKVESIGLDRLLNVEAVNEFLQGQRNFDCLPAMRIELYLDGDFDHTMNGNNNSDEVPCDGIRLVCEPNSDYQNEIIEAMKGHEEYFPYDYYSIRFSTFSDEGYTGYKNKLRSMFINSTNMSSDYATNEFIRHIYNQYTEDDAKERAVHKSKYRQMKQSFRENAFRELNDKVPADKDYSFGLKLSSTTGLDSDLMIYEDKVGIDSKGTGCQVFIKTDFSLERSGKNIDVVLIEEPENHLSHVNLRKLIEKIVKTQSGQLFIATHNSLISTRLELHNLFIMHDQVAGRPTVLDDLSESTVKYFIKAPVAGILEFAIAKKSILVEGPSEYMLFEKFYESVTGNKPEDDNVQIIDVHGLSFKRYLDIAVLLRNKVAVVTDNDGDVQKNCIDKYKEFTDNENIKIFYEKDDCASKSTFEEIIYTDNRELCDKLFGDDGLSQMLSKKTEAAYLLLEQEKPISVPTYIQGAIEWIKK